MINYFFNIASKYDDINFYTDVLTNIRKDFYHSKEKIKGKITQNSSLNSVFYEYSLEQNKNMKWKVHDDTHIYSESKPAQDGKYYVCFYNQTGMYKQLTFSKLHTLLKIEYFNQDKSSSPYLIIEPRKSNNGLCLLLNEVGSYQSVVLFAMPCVDDDYVSDKIDLQFSDFSAVASTNEGVVKFLDSNQLDSFNTFVQKAFESKSADNAPVSFIDESEAVLAKKLNPKDFNVKKNLSQAIDITNATEFDFNDDDAFEQMLEESIGFVEITSNDDETVLQENPQADYVENDKFEEISFESTDTLDDQDVLYAPIESSFVEYTLSDSDEVVAVKEDFEAKPIETVLSEDDTAVLDSNFDDIDVNDDSIAQDCSDLAIEEATVEVDADIEADVIEADVIEADEQIQPAVIDESEDSVCDAECEADAPDFNADVNDENFITKEYDTPDCIIESSNIKYNYYGSLDEDNLRSGFGRTATDDGHTAYEGEYFNNKRNGIGAYYYKDGKLCYYGDWKDNKRDGFGIGVSSIDNSVHVGKFVNNKLSGDGVRINKDGEVLFIQKTLSNGMNVLLEFDGDKIIVKKHNESGEIISENSSNLKYF